MFINLKKGVAHDSYAAGFCFLMQLPCMNSSYAVETHLVGPATFPSIKAARNAPQQERGRISGIILDGVLGDVVTNITLLSIIAI